jgi:DNA-binding NarL/FixJ family response regulator
MTSDDVIRLAIADDHPLVLLALEELFRSEPGIEVVARCRTSDEIMPMVHGTRPQILLFDKQMPGQNSFEVVRHLRTFDQPPLLILLTGQMTDDEMLDAMRSGVRGILLKSMPPRLIVDCVRKVAAGEQWLEKESVGRAVERMLQREEAEAEVRKILTTREIEMVRMVARGLRNKEIAERTFITAGTVRSHLYNIFQKLNLANRMELAAYARRHRLVAPLGRTGDSSYE